MDYSEYFYYDETSKSCLRWKYRKDNEWMTDKEAGTIDRSKSRPTFTVSLKGKSYVVSRVIWQIFNGELARNITVSFKDNDSTNLKISNLCLKSISQINSENSRPRSLMKMNTRFYTLWSGVKERCGHRSRQWKHYEDIDMLAEWINDSKAFCDYIATVENVNSKDDFGQWFHIEKDLFSYNNPVRRGYYPENICFLPRDLNQVIQLEHPRQRMDGRVLPLGVTKDGNRYKAQISINGKIKYLGSSTDMWICAELYKVAKIARIQELHEIWRNRLPERVNNQLELFVNDLKAHREIFSANDT